MRVEDEVRIGRSHLAQRLRDVGAIMLACLNEATNFRQTVYDRDFAT